MGNGFLTYIVQNKNPRNLAKAKKKMIIIEKLENATSDQFKQKLRGEYRIKHRKAKKGYSERKKNGWKKELQMQKRLLKMNLRNCIS